MIVSASQQQSLLNRRYFKCGIIAFARALLFGLITFACYQVAFAITFKDYHQRVKEAVTVLGEIHVGDESQLPDYDRSRLFQVRQLLPRQESVDWLDTVFVTDNGWVDDRLKDVERIDTTPPARRVALEQTRQRLQALEDRLTECDKLQQAFPTKADERAHLASILQRPDYARAIKEESALSRIIQWLVRLIERLLPARKSMSPARASTLSRLAQVIVVVIALAAIGYVVWMFAPKVLHRRKAKRAVKAAPRVVLGERLEPEKSAADLLAEAEALARSGDLRGAIRRSYIALLVELADRKLISLAQYKTNRDYLGAVKSSTRLYRQMESLTNNFEIHWYGLVPPKENDWTSFRAGYYEALNDV